MVGDVLHALQLVVFAAAAPGSATLCFSTLDAEAISCSERQGQEVPRPLFSPLKLLLSLPKCRLRGF